MNAFFCISSLLLTFHWVLLGPYELWDRRACQHSHQKLSGIEFNKQEATYKNIESEKWHTKAEVAFAAKVPICRCVLHGHWRRESMFSGRSSRLQFSVLWCGISTLIPLRGLCHPQSTQDPQELCCCSWTTHGSIPDIWSSTSHASKNQWKRTSKERPGVHASQCHLCSSASQRLPFLGVSVWSACWRIHLRINWDLPAQSDNSPMPTFLVMMQWCESTYKPESWVVPRCLFMVGSTYTLCFSSWSLSLRAGPESFPLMCLSLWLLVVGSPSVLADHWTTPIPIRGLAHSREACLSRTGMRLWKAFSIQNKVFILDEVLLKLRNTLMKRIFFDHVLYIKHGTLTFTEGFLCTGHSPTYFILIHT